MTSEAVATTSAVSAPDRRARTAWFGAAGACMLLLASTVASLGGVDWATITTPGMLLVAVVAAGIWLSIIDGRSKRLPNAIMNPFACTMAFGVLCLAITEHTPVVLLTSLGGAAGMWALYLVFGLAGGTGTGDIKLATVLGAWAATAGWETLLAAAILPYVLALPHTVWVIARRRSTRGAIPFGPYLIAGAIITYVTIGWATTS